MESIQGTTVIDSVNIEIMVTDLWSETEIAELSFILPSTDSARLAPRLDEIAKSWSLARTEWDVYLDDRRTHDCITYSVAA